MKERTCTVATFGESGKGEFRTAYFCHDILQLYEKIGEPVEGAAAIDFAVQALLQRQNVIFFRIAEEGFSEEDYLAGLRFLGNTDLVQGVNAVYLPGVGTERVIQQAIEVCELHNSILVMNEADLYDYMTDVYPQDH